MHLEKIASASVNFTCISVLFGDWVSISKSAIYTYERLFLCEMRVFSFGVSKTNHMQQHPYSSFRFP